jgi:hypothetical protein
MNEYMDFLGNLPPFLKWGVSLIVLVLVVFILWVTWFRTTTQETHPMPEQKPSLPNAAPSKEAPAEPAPTVNRRAGDVVLTDANVSAGDGTYGPGAPVVIEGGTGYDGAGGGHAVISGGVYRAGGGGPGGPGGHLIIKGGDAK